MQEAPAAAVDEKYAEALKRGGEGTEKARKMMKYYHPLTQEQKDALARKYVEKQYH